MLLAIRCAPTSQFSDVITVQTNDHRFSPGTFGQGISRCPAGYYAFDGGGYFSSEGTVLGAASGNSTNTPSADGNAWTYAGVAPAGVRTTLVTVTQCAPRTGHDFLVQFGNVSTSSATETSSSVDCPSGYTAIAGGLLRLRPRQQRVHHRRRQGLDLGGRTLVRQWLHPRPHETGRIGPVPPVTTPAAHRASP
jgi:hypothetical protein